MPHNREQRNQDDLQSCKVERISAVTLATRDMPASVRFYRSLGLAIRHGGEDAQFTSFAAGDNFLNLFVSPGDEPPTDWGRVIFHVSDVDAIYRRVLELGLSPETEPRDAEWGERYFHIRDPDGHELSFARPLT